MYKIMENENAEFFSYENKDYSLAPYYCRAKNIPVKLLPLTINGILDDTYTPTEAEYAEYAEIQKKRFEEDAYTSVYFYKNNGMKHYTTLLFEKVDYYELVFELKLPSYLLGEEMIRIAKKHPLYHE
jgi:hypothetical protein